MNEPIVIELPSYRALNEMPPDVRDSLMVGEMKRTAHALQAGAIDGAFTPQGRLRFVALWRAWLDGATAVLQSDPQWSPGAAVVFQTFDQLLDYLEGRDVPPHMEKLFGGSRDAYEA